MYILAFFLHMSFLAFAAPGPRKAPGAQTVVYWGQNGGGTIENNDLSAYCTASSGVDIIILAFLYQFGNGHETPSGTIGQSCFISSSGYGQNCDSLSSAITKCQANGVKVILSLGGAAGAYSLQSVAQAQAVGHNLWSAYGNSGNTSIQRPLGSAFVNGFDFDIESSNGNQYYASMISSLRSRFKSDPNNTYYITGAPQCPIPEPYMGQSIESTTFDYLWVQFYNNNNYTYPCALPYNGNAPFNYDQWVNFTAGTPSYTAKIFIGVPAAPLAANGGPSGETYYITPPQLAQLISRFKSHSRFGGIMMWSAGFSDSNINNGCTYAQEAHSILMTGSPCDQSGPASLNTTISKVAVPKPKINEAIPQWGQCGGIGYMGPTQCQAPYTCVTGSVWWAQCK